ncbi:MAG TPA: universal stress protein [Thermoanaerobaculia bacterium]
MTTFRRILMATDFSEASLPAWDCALSLAADNEADLFLVHAYEPPNLVHTGGIVAGHYQEWDQSVRAKANERLDVLVAQARKAGIRAHRSVEAGNADEAVIQAAKDLEADLIVMGTHGRTGISRVFLGSVASRVVATAPCPVLTVRAPETPKLATAAGG